MKHTNAIVQSKILFFLAWRNLVYKKMRTMLTIIGIVIGVSAIFFLLSFGIGVQQLVTNGVIGDQSVKSIDITTSNSKVVSLGTDNYRKIKDLPHVVKIGTLHSYAGVVTSAGGKLDAIVYGADQGYLDLTHLVLVAGKPLDFGSSELYTVYSD